MIRLSKQDTRALVAVLREAEEHSRERAVYDAMRARAMKSIGEKLLTKAHEGYANAAVVAANRARDWADRLESASAVSITASGRRELED